MTVDRDVGGWGQDPRSATLWGPTAAQQPVRRVEVNCWFSKPSAAAGSDSPRPRHPLRPLVAVHADGPGAECGRGGRQRWGTT